MSIYGKFRVVLSIATCLVYTNRARWKPLDIRAPALVCCGGTSIESWKALAVSVHALNIVVVFGKVGTQILQIGRISSRAFASESQKPL